MNPGPASFDHETDMQSAFSDIVVPGFVIVSLLGQGNATNVYLARQRYLNRFVAVKALNPCRASPQLELRLRNEARVVSRLAHPNIVPLHELLEVDNRFFCIFEYVEGGNLRKRMKGERFTPDEAAKLVETVARTLQFVHERGFVHCDLKPENILLSSMGEPKIADFGLAIDSESPHDSSPETGVKGTPRYMAPEQIDRKGQVVGPPADIHALGVILYELMTGRTPYIAVTVADTLQQVCLYPPLRPKKLNPKLPIDLETICLRCLVKNPLSRYRSAVELADDLKRFVRREPILAREVGKLERFMLWGQRHPSVFALVSMIVLVFSIAIGLFVHQYRSTYIALANSRDTEARRHVDMVESLKIADQRSVPFILESMKSSWSSIAPRIQAAINQEGIAENERTRFRLALIEEHPKVLNDLRLRLAFADPEEFDLIVHVAQQKKDLVPASIWQSYQDDLCEAALDTNLVAEAKFRVLTAIAFHRLPVEWNALQLKSIAEELLKTNPLHLATWTQLLESLHQQLCDPLSDCFRDRSKSPEARRRAATLLASFAADQPRRLADLILWSDVTNFETLMMPMRRFPQESTDAMHDVLRKKPESETRVERQLRQEQQANAAIVLMKLGSPEAVWPLLKHSKDPSLRSRLIHWFSAVDVDPKLLMERFKVETDVSTRRAMLLAIGEYPVVAFTEEDRRTWLASVASLFVRDKDPGIHAACEWVMQKWNYPVPSIAASEASTDDAIQGNRDWFVNSQGQSFCVVRGSIDTIMGSPDDEPERESTEVVHAMRIRQTYAIGMKEVSVEQYQRFAPEGGEPTKVKLGPSYPACMMDYFDAARYCRWLSEQEGVPENQMCYPEMKLIKEGFVPNPNYLNRTGYRIPSEAELEHSMRVGAVTQFCFGDFDDLLGNYAWHALNSDHHPHPPGLLKPNDLGLFDCHGNVREYGQEWISHSSTEGPKIIRAIDEEDMSRIVNTGHYRIARSGSYRDFVFNIRSARRDKQPPLQRSLDCGIRLVRTLPSADDK
jgi:serine/threonine protein kinase/formylglycine-generating enzyme required for sulfatase activity